MEFLSGGERTLGPLGSTPCEDSSDALAGKQRRLRARILASQAGDAPQGPPCLAGLWFASSCFRCSHRKFAGGKGTFLAYNPELLPSNSECGPLGTGDRREPLLSTAPAPSPGTEPRRELASPAVPAPLNPPRTGRPRAPRGGCGRDPRGCLRICSCAFPLPGDKRTRTYAG